MSRILGVVAVACLAASPAFADRPILAMHPMHVDPSAVPAVVNSHVLFLNRCKNGCTVHYGNPDSTTDTSDIGQGALTPYQGGDSRWSQVVACVKKIMSPFNITVTDVDPGSAPHFEVMAAGSACQIIQNSSCQFIGGIADFACTSPGSCSPYIPNALVFDFSDSWGGSVTEDCGTIAQEIAHTWSLDHATPNNDPMTYNPLAPPLNYQDNAPCGSDCQNGVSPFQLPCNGQFHQCMSSGQSTQNEIQIIKKVFGPAGAQAPTLSVTPSDGSAEQPGFTVQANCSSSDGIQEVDFSVDGKPEASLSAAPYKFTTATTLTNGSHTIDVLCGTNLQATASKTIHVIIGTKCSSDSDCMTNDICYESACIPGMNATGGLGATCMANSDCASGACGNDGTKQVCVVPCDPNNDQCPGGFGCLPSGSSGVCWPGAAHGSSGGGCDAGGGSPAGPLGLGLGLVALLVVRRRKTGDA